MFDEADDFLRRSSFGQVSLHGDVTPWLNAFPSSPACPPPVHERVAPALSDPPTQAAARAGYTPASYDRVIYIVPPMECPWKALGVNREVFLNGELSPWHVVHELGHTFGLAHAHGQQCTTAGRPCSTTEYGDPLSPMGHGLVDFSAYEKIKLGWLRDDVVRAREPGTFRIGRPDVLAAAPYALVVQTGRGEYWLDQAHDGLAVRTIERDVPDDDLAPSTRFIAVGATFAAAGAFSARLTPVDSSHADVQFAWTDRVRPTKPVLRAPARVRAGTPIRVAWSSRDTGSGLASCLVRVDARTVAQLETETSATVGPVSAGTRRIRVTCTDRAGNQSRAGTKRIRALRG